MSPLVRFRRVDQVRIALGTLALAEPRAVLLIARAADGHWPRRLTRLLGARLVAQAVVGTVVADRRVLAADSAVELTHALSTLGLAAQFPGHRRLAATSGVLALGLAAADLRDYAGRRTDLSLLTTTRRSAR